ncbi:hypothetical protein A3H16_03885 [Candidatus Kaiserbacteria bacterium RIFCSPLOWO2_12_FULL_53_8]|uniref:Uncharacterized protein n=2 Tax=Candidatus Kaiseribacteriota TaxID=1752734 RepID=A0A1F6CUT2_9BACT|nr:MAG: hypothetical protein A2851_04690 [Candidatus Kaiserbacteria bacterium RIFCSPHIGHO2_01_FULL_53_29]OGG90838.1 MAG: hypothetical protein A3H16_03885 [Candidatus Kaiserbacteria bacterium RIFCSPLOWO2_12_FULL_53_8]
MSGKTIPNRFFAAVVGASFLFLASPSFAAASSLVWGNVEGGDPVRIEILDGGTYVVPLNTPAPAFIDSPFAFFDFTGTLYRIDDSGGTPVREEIATINCLGCTPESTLEWSSAGQYELDLPLFEPASQNFNDTLKRWLARVFFAEIAHAQIDPIETIHFTIEEAAAACANPCLSSIFFIPGFQASRLYQGNVISENQVWEPNSLQSDVQKLYLDENGASINPTYTKADAAIDSVGPFFSRTDIYRTFLEQLGSLVANDTIAGFGVFPYDWRVSVDDIVENGTIYNDGTHYPAAELESLAAGSMTGKVTIVAHSNGGLVAKALMRKLEAEGNAGLVDKIIFVGTPQLGTPKAIASLLHGDFQNIPGWAGFLVSKANARALGENMPGAFGLLPSPEYFARVADPVVDLSAAPALRAGAGLSLPTVDSAAELAKFLTGAGGRAQPAFDKIEIPSVLSSTLLSNATALHNDLDTWTPPAGVEVFQIAGWGLDTPKNVVYTEKRQAFCITASCSSATTTHHVVKMTEDGDQTVVSASAAVEDTFPVYYLNLISYKAETRHDVRHAYLTEAKPFQDLLLQLISTTTSPILPAHISNTRPQSTSAEKRLRLRVLSPVSLDAYDNLGNHTGMAPNPTPGSDLLYKEEDIFNSYYEEFGEGKYLGLPEGTYTINLKGLAQGTFTFEITPVTGGIEGTTTSYIDIPVSVLTTGTTTIDASGQLGSLALDQNGDGVADTIITSPTQATDPLTYAKLIKTSIAGMDMGAKTKRQLIAKFANVGYMIAKLDKWENEDDDGKETNKTGKLTERIIKKLGKIEQYIKKQLAKSAPKLKQNKVQLERITPAQAEALLDMLSTLKKLVIIK